MKILLVMDPGILVPPKGYGGIERIVEMMAKEYVKLGHEVHLFVTEGSYVAGCTMHPFGKEGFPPKRSDANTAILVAWRFLWKHRNDFDLIHNFGRLAYLLPVLRHPVRKIMSYQREISSRNIRLINSLKGRNMMFTACSGNLLSRLRAKGAWEVVYNAIEKSKYQLTQNLPADAPLIFLGRIERVKGCHIAIEVAKATGNKLVIAGNVSTLPEEKAYYEKEILPLIDGEQIIYLGVLNDEQKNEWLGKSKAMLFPIEWDEPFGIVMIEAMACGTPVIGISRGSVMEVVEEGITGFKVHDVEGMTEAVKKIPSINREFCRKAAIERFDASVIAARYLQINHPSRKKIVIVTTGQPAANPRVVKEYETLVECGYNVKVVYTFSAQWSYEIDQKKFQTGELKKQDFIEAGGNPYTAKLYYLFSRAFFRLMYWSMKVIPFSFIKEMAVARPALALWVRSRQIDADIYMAHYVGALPGAVRAAKKHAAVFSFDAEDFHRGEPVYYATQKEHVSYVEGKCLPHAVFISAASPLIAAGYQELFPGKKVITLNNVFSKKFLQKPSASNNNGLSIFWFSQNIGPNRGLETAIEAMNIAGGDVSLYLLGNTRNQEYYQALLAKSKAPEKIHVIAPVPPEEVFEIAAKFDIGLASEMPLSVNRDICLTNKIFTYLLAGNCVLVSDTAAQKAFMEQYPGVGLLYKADDANCLAGHIKKLAGDRQLLAAYKAAALRTSSGELNWEAEQEKLKAAISAAI